jgi:putative ABC transport system ATP-binding protein
MTTIVQSIGLSKTYGAGQTCVTALKPTDLTIHQGEFLAVVGPSGSGKSSLLHLLGGLEKPSTGQVIIAGNDLYSLSENQRSVFRRRSIGFIFQFYNLIPVLSARENVLLPLLLDGRRPDQAYIGELFGLLGLENRLRHLPGELSGGQQQRVAIARALANQPAVIFADEPTGNLDTRTSQEVVQLLYRTSQRFGQTIVLITHDPRVAAYADRVLELVDGQIQL